MLRLIKNNMRSIHPHRVQLLNHILEYLKNMLYIKNQFVYKTFQLCVVSQRNYSSSPFSCLHAHSCLTTKHQALWLHYMCYCQHVQNKISSLTLNIRYYHEQFPSMPQKQKTTNDTKKRTVSERAYFNCYARKTVF